MCKKKKYQLIQHLRTKQIADIIDQRTNLNQRKINMELFKNHFPKDVQNNRVSQST